MTNPITESQIEYIRKIKHYLHCSGVNTDDFPNEEKMTKQEAYVFIKSHVGLYKKLRHHDNVRYYKSKERCYKELS